MKTLIHSIFPLKCVWLMKFWIAFYRRTKKLKRINIYWILSNWKRLPMSIDLIQEFQKNIGVFELAQFLPWRFPYHTSHMKYIPSNSMSNQIVSISTESQISFSWLISDNIVTIFFLSIRIWLQFKLNNWTLTYRNVKVLFWQFYWLAW